MIKIVRKKGESVDAMLRRYKQKRRKADIQTELRGRQEYTKPSVARRKELLDAKYQQKKRNLDRD